MISDLLKFLNALNMCPYYSFLFLEYTDIPIYLSVCELLIFEVFKCCWDLILRLVIEHDVVGPRGII